MKGLASAATVLGGFILATNALLCTSQGADSCNLSLEGVFSSQLNGQLFVWEELGIFNHNCNQIGGVRNPREGQAIYSQLPYTVVLTHLPQGTNIADPYTIGMCYAGYCYEGSFACQSYGSYLYCEHGFPCPGF